MRPWRALVLPFVLAALSSITVLSAAPLRGHSKALISHPNGQPQAAAVATVIGNGGKVLSDSGLIHARFSAAGGN